MAERASSTGEFVTHVACKTSAFLVLRTLHCVQTNTLEVSCAHRRDDDMLTLRHITTRCSSVPWRFERLWDVERHQLSQLLRCRLNRRTHRCSYCRVHLCFLCPPIPPRTAAYLCRRRCRRGVNYWWPCPDATGRQLPHAQSRGCCMSRAVVSKSPAQIVRKARLA